jgi:hypothetical protein
MSHQGQDGKNNRYGFFQCSSSFWAKHLLLRLPEFWCNFNTLLAERLITTRGKLNQPKIDLP